MSYLLSCALSLALLIVSLPAYSGGSVSYSYEGIARSGPMAIGAVLNDWKGKFYKEDDGFLWQQILSSVRIENTQVSYVDRRHAEYRFPHQLAKGFYYATNDISLPSVYKQKATVKAQDYRGYGWQLDHSFSTSKNLTITPTITWLKVNRSTWGRIKGDVFYQNPDEQGGRLEVDYGYTEDKVLKRPLAQNYYGDLYALGLALEWQKGVYDVYYRGENLLAELHWQNLPYTDAIVDTSARFLLDGFEFHKKKRERPRDIHWLNQSYQISPNWTLIVNSMLTSLFITHDIGARWHLSHTDIDLSYNPFWKSVTTAVSHKNIGIRLTSDNINIGESRTLVASGFVALSF